MLRSPLRADDIKHYQASANCLPDFPSQCGERISSLELETREGVMWETAGDGFKLFRVVDAVIVISFCFLER